MKCGKTKRIGPEKSRNFREPYNKDNYTVLKDLPSINRKSNYIISVVYDLPKKEPSRNCWRRIFNPTPFELSKRINLFKFAISELESLKISNLIAICLPADFIVMPYSKNSKFISDINSFSIYRDLVQAWNNLSKLLIFGIGLGYEKKDGNPEENQGICTVKNDGKIFLATKYQKSPLKFKMNGRGFVLAVCFDLEKFNNPDNGYSFDSEILINCRHLSCVGEPSGGVRSGRLPKIINELINQTRNPDIQTKLIFCPVFRFSEETPGEWNFMRNFAWAGKSELAKPSQFKPIGCLKIAKLAKNEEKNEERAFFNIFEI